MNNFEQLNVEANQANDHKSIVAIIEKLSHLIERSSESVEMLRLRANLWVKIDEKGKAINDYNAILKLAPDNTDAGMQIQFLKTILRFNNSDIYANPNTNMDPWFE